jgi:hypothetical protein
MHGTLDPRTGGIRTGSVRWYSMFAVGGLNDSESWDRHRRAGDEVRVGEPGANDEVRRWDRAVDEQRRTGSLQA